MSTSIDEQVESDRRTEYKEPGDDEKFSHYADKEAVSRAMFEGTPCTALCGKRWVPTRDPKKFPVCPECKDVYETLQED